eukprot:4448436-Prymnesium_polylepis.2
MSTLPSVHVAVLPREKRAGGAPLDVDHDAPSEGPFSAGCQPPTGASPGSPSAGRPPSRLSRSSVRCPSTCRKKPRQPLYVWGEQRCAAAARGGGAAGEAVRLHERQLRGGTEG